MLPAQPAPRHPPPGLLDAPVSFLLGRPGRRPFAPGWSAMVGLQSLIRSWGPQLKGLSVVKQIPKRMRKPNHH